MDYFHDVVIIGTGAAGLTAALHLGSQAKVAVLCKSTFNEGSTMYAQGGIAAVLDQEDTLENHIQDTLVAGWGLCDPHAVSFTVRRAKSAIEWLIAQGVEFTHHVDEKGERQYHLHQEGGHSHRRILHAKDATGRSMQTTLAQVVKSKENIQYFEHKIAIDFIIREGRCVGVYVLDVETGTVDTFHAKAFILATGGASRVYLYSTNPFVSSGDGIAMAWRAGARVANMEFNQFHPTCLYAPQGGSFLISEAMRGEGAKLLLPDGTRFMPKFHPSAELAPRDIVARAIDTEMKRLGLECVYLDITHKSANFICEHFPMIYERCLSLGLDITRERIPVVPAAHYTCGGVVVNDQSQTNIPGLYACGEVSYTGLHGANRMASNSLLECLVYAISASEDILKNIAHVSRPAAQKPWDESWVKPSPEEIYVTYNWEEIRRCMWNYVGIVRSDQRLARAAARIDLLKNEVQDYYAHFKVSRDLIELRNIVVVADLIIRSAQLRKESRGLHTTLDYPEVDEALAHPTILEPNISLSK